MDAWIMKVGTEKHFFCKIPFSERNLPLHAPSSKAVSYMVRVYEQKQQPTITSKATIHSVSDVHSGLSRKRHKEVLRTKYARPG